MLFKIDENMPIEAVELLAHAGYLAHTRLSMSDLPVVPIQTSPLLAKSSNGR